MFTVDYSHELNAPLHTVDGAVEALRVLFPGAFPATVLDVGCGTGTWLRASRDRGAEVRGVDGWVVDPKLLRVPGNLIKRADLNRSFDLGRKFELVICLETAEHLEPENAETLIDALVRHGDRILFSAAAPGQAGTHHVNCQWPDYWQEIFNSRGFSCSDSARWEIWNESNIEPWYRQNLMWAIREPGRAGTEERIKPVVHPDLMPSYAPLFLSQNLELIEAGGLLWPWYLRVPLKAMRSKIRQRLLKSK